MKKKITFNGSVNDLGLYVTASFIFENPVEIKALKQHASDFYTAFYGGHSDDYSRELNISANSARGVVCYIHYKHDDGPDMEEDLAKKWDEMIKRDAENLITQLEVGLSVFETENTVQSNKSKSDP